MALIIKNCNLIDGTGKSPIQNQSIRVEDGKIEWIGNNEQFPYEIDKGDQIIEISGVTVMPGMMDTHIHITQGYEVDQDDFHNKVTTGPKKPSSGKTNSFSIMLTKAGKPQRKALQMQIYNTGKSYELNMYIQ